MLVFHERQRANGGSGGRDGKPGSLLSKHLSV